MDATNPNPMDPTALVMQMMKMMFQQQQEQQRLQQEREEVRYQRERELQLERDRLERERLREEARLERERQEREQALREERELRREQLHQKMFMEALQLMRPNQEAPIVHNLKPSQQPSIDPINVEELVNTKLEQVLRDKFPNAAPTTDIQPTKIERYMEARYRKMKPDLYQQLMQRYDEDPYVHRRFTTSISGAPLFLRSNEDIDDFIFQHKPIMTDFIWYDTMDDARRSNYRRLWTLNDPEYAKLLVFIDDQDANPEELLTATNQAFKYEVRLTRLGNSKTTYNMVKLVGSEELDFDPNAVTNPSSVYVKDVEEDIDIENATAKGIKFINSLITYYDIVFKLELFDNLDPLELHEAFTVNLRKSVFNILRYRNSMKPSMLNIYVRYLATNMDGKIVEHIVNVFKGRRTDQLHHLTVEPDLVDQLNSQGSDVKDVNTTFTIDYSSIVLTITSPIAGGSESFSQVEELVEAIKSGRKRTVVINAGKVRTCERAYNDESCFVRILAEQIKKQSYRMRYPRAPTFTRYDKLWRYLDKTLGMDTYQKSITLEQAAQMGAHFNINVVIYDEDGNILRNDEVDTPLRLDIVYFNDHYSHLIEVYNSQKRANYFTIPKRKRGNRKDYNQIDCPIFYDLETVYNHALGSTNSLLPYSVSYQPQSEYLPNEMKTLITDDPTPDPNKASDLVSRMMLDIVDSCVGLIRQFKQKQLEEGGPGKITVINLMMIAYNGSGFDHIILFRYLALRGYQITQSPTGNKIRSMSANLYATEEVRRWGLPGQSTSSARDHYYIRVCTWDPYTFLVRSMNSAARSFGLDIQKNEFDHLLVQREYEENRFPQFIQEHGQSIREYNEKDVTILRELTNTFNDTIMNTLGISPMQFSTIAAMARKQFGSMIYKGPIKTSIQVDSSDNDDAEVDLSDVTIEDIEEAMSGQSSVPATREVNLEADILPLYATPEEIKAYQLKYQRALDHVNSNLGIVQEDDVDQDAVDRILTGLTNKKMIVPPKDHIQDQDIRSAIIAGRVEGIVGDHRGNFVLVDVVSLYPYIMMSRGFPVGDSRIETNIKNCIRIFKNEATTKCGVYYCRIDQSTLDNKLHHPIYPARRPRMGLDWSLYTAKNEVYEVWVDDVTIRLLLLHKAKVKLIQSPNTRSGYIWDLSPPGAMFREYMLSFGQLKAEQDRLLREKSPDYNPTLREFSKLMLNALSGIMAEKSYNKSTKYFSSLMFDQLHRLVDQLDKKNIDYEINVITTQMASITYEVMAKLKAVHTGVYVYAHARAYMYTILYALVKVFYSDTDSAVLHMSQFIAVLKKLKLMGTDLDLVSADGIKLFGMLEVEHIGVNIMIIAPKFYMLYKLDNGVPEVVKYRMKGISSKDTVVIDGKESVVEDVVWEVFQLLAGGNEVVFRTSGIKKTLREGKIAATKIDKKIKFDKIETYYYNDDGEIISDPSTVEENEVIEEQSEVSLPTLLQDLSDPSDLNTNTSEYSARTEEISVSNPSEIGTDPSTVEEQTIEEQTVNPKLADNYRSAFRPKKEMPSRRVVRRIRGDINSKINTISAVLDTIERNNGTVNRQIINNLNRDLEELFDNISRIDIDNKSELLSQVDIMIHIVIKNMRR